MWHEYHHGYLTVYALQVDHIPAETLKIHSINKKIDIDPSCKNIRVLLNEREFALLNYNEYKFTFNKIIFWFKYITTDQYKEYYKFIHLPRCDPSIHYSRSDLFNLICCWILENYPHQSEYTVSIINHSIATVHSSNYGTVFSAFIQVR